MAIKVGGTTLRDYVGADGNPGTSRRSCTSTNAPASRAALRQAGQAFTQGQRSTYYCAACQK